MLNVGANLLLVSRREAGGGGKPGDNDLDIFLLGDGPTCCVVLECDQGPPWYHGGYVPCRSGGCVYAGV